MIRNVFLGVTLGLSILSLDGAGAQEPMPLPAPRAFANEIYQDFRGRKPLVDELRLVGPNLDVVKAEEGGLRITVPATQKSGDTTGVRLNFPLAGDFELTARYELLSADMPRGGGGVGLAWNVSNHKKFSRFGRFVLPKRGNVYLAESRAAGPPQGPPHVVPTDTTSGQLRIIRTGAKLIYLVADEPPARFRVIHEAEFTADDMPIVRWAATTNASAAGVDVRLVDLRIRYGDEAPGPIAAPVAQTGILQAPRLLTTLMLCGVAPFVLVGIAVGCWLWLRIRRSSVQADSVVDAGPALASAIAFDCPGCGRQLKTTCDLIGKKVKCSQCGMAALVPNA